MQEIIVKEPIDTSTATASFACTVGTMPPMTTYLGRMEKSMELQGAISELMEYLEVLEAPVVA